VHKRAKGDSKEPGFLTAAVEVKPRKGNENEKQEGVAEYPAVAKGIAEEDLSQGLVNDVRKKCAYEEESQVYFG